MPRTAKTPARSNRQPETGPRLLHSLALGNILSFGPEPVRLPLSSLNVLVGANGSGKSNVLEAIALLRSAPTDLRPVITRGGGVGEWIWKGDPRATATLEAVIDYPAGSQPLRHVLAFQAETQRFRLSDERIENALPGNGAASVQFSYRQAEEKIVVVREGAQRQLRVDAFQSNASILAQLRDPESYPEINYLADLYDRVRLYRDWTMGRNAKCREPQPASGRSDRLQEDFSNLGLFLSRLRRNSKTKATLLKNLRNVYDGLTDFDISIEEGTVQVFFSEGDFTIPATRLSDGGLRYLCLLAILCDPDPPPLIGLEQPELGLHFDLIPGVADLLVAASKRTQLIVTTYSDIMVDALTEHPESLVICEKRKGQTSLQHYPREELRRWLEKYRLGDLWTSGQLGGKRW